MMSLAKRVKAGECPQGVSGHCMHPLQEQPGREGCCRCGETRETEGEE